MKRLTLEQYRNMVEEIIEFKKLNGEMPEYTTVEGCKISRESFIDMIEMVNKFLLEMGRNPGTIEIREPDEDNIKLKKFYSIYNIQKCF